MERSLRNQLPGGKFAETTPQRSETMRSIRGKDNKTTERRLRLGLVRSAITGWKVRPKGLKGSPDFLFPQYCLAVFVDGCYWHGCPRCGHLPQKNRGFWRAKIARNRERDREAVRELKRQGIRVVRFWEHELLTGLERCIQIIESLLSSPT